MSGYVGVFDRYLLLIWIPSRKEFSNVRPFFSGHYQRMGFNVQAMVDCNLKFQYAAISKGGRSGEVLGCVLSNVGAAPASGSILRQKLTQKLLSKSISHPNLIVKH